MVLWFFYGSYGIYKEKQALKDDSVPRNPCVTFLSVWLCVAQLDSLSRKNAKR